MNRIARILLAAIVTSGVLLPSLLAAEQSQRYIVILKQRSGAAPDVAALGGTIELRQEDELIVTIPPGALAALRSDPKVRYIERVGGQPSPSEDSLIGVPSDPQPGGTTQARRLTPQVLGSISWDSGTYLYDGAGNIVSIGSDNYLYDGDQRLKQSSTKGTAETYTYDGFGNMKTRTNTIVPPPDPSTNRSGGYGYNEIGAVTSDGSYAFTYDALGQPTSKEYNGDSNKLEYYVYTPSDERIGVQRGTWWWWSVRDEGGKVLRQYKSSTTNPAAASLWLEDFVWRDGLLLGSQRPVEMGGRRHFHLDHLGTPRLITSDAGQMVSYHDYYPFGDEHSPIPQEVPGGFDREDPMKFTGQERDYAGGMGGEDGHALDYMHARYSNPSLGRFLSLDPVEGAEGVPQSWNRYAYVTNRPVTLTDPDGQQISIVVTAPQPVIDPVEIARQEEDFRLWVWSTIIYHAQEGYHYFDRKSTEFDHKLAILVRFGFEQKRCGTDAECANQIYEIAGVYDVGGEFSDAKFAAQLGKQLAKDGVASVEKSIASLEKRLLVHEAKVGGLKYKSSVEREIRTFRRQIETAKQFLRWRGLM